MDNAHSFFATLTVNVFVSDADFNFIYSCFQKHYDTRIKMAADVGGWLYGRRIHRTPFDGWNPTDNERIVEFTSNQIDSVLKSLEFNDTKQGSDINFRFYKIISEMKIQQQTINKNITGFLTNLK